MFWRFGGYANLSTLDSILDKPDVTVEELLEESDLIQELKQQNSKLIEFLRDEAVLNKLLHYVIAQPTSTSEEDKAGDAVGKEKGSQSEGFFGKVRVKRASLSSRSDSGDGEESKEEKQRMKYAYVACEILSSEVWSISEALLENQDSLRSFWQYIKNPPPLDPVQAGYFTKVNESLFDRKTEEMLDFFKGIDNVVPDMLQHVDCPTMMDLLLKIVSLEKSDGGQGIVDWLQAQNLIPILLSYLSQEHSSSTQTSAGDFLKAIITISANATTQDQSVIGPNELTRQLVSEKCIRSLIGNMLRGGNPLTVGVGIIIEVIRKNNSDYDLDNQIGPVPKSSDPIYLGTLLRQFAIHISAFMELVHNSNHTIVNSDGTKTVRRRELKAAFGEKIEPLGFDRFKTCELMAELLHCSNMALLNERGSEAEVERRDAERERLKAEGKLQPAKPVPVDEYGTSVDSHGFHHARAPSSESPEEIRRLEVQNHADEDEFEKVAAPEGDVKDEYGKEEIGEPLERSPKVFPQKREAGEDASESVVVQAPKEEAASTGEPSEEKPDPACPPSSGDNAESPTSASLTDKVGSPELENDTEMASPPVSGNDTVQPVKESTSLLTQQLSHTLNDAEELGISPHPDDKPAPLFSGNRNDTEEGKAGGFGSLARLESEGSDITPIEDAGSSKSILLNAEEDDSWRYEVDIDGTPVVGDYLKIMFVENKVVPTILDFFFRFPWNNFLHNVVYDVVQQVFNGTMERGFNRRLAIDLFESGRITERIVEGQQASDKSQAETNMRLGYMGHLTLIAEEVLKFTERHPPELLSQSVLDKVMSPAWIDYVEHTLAETRERDNAILGGVRPDMAGGTRQAVLNAVNSGSNYGNNGMAGNASVGLDTMELTNSSGGGYGFNGGTLLSGFNNSSDEEDEEMEEGDGERDRERQQNTIGVTGHLSDSDQPVNQNPSSEDAAAKSALPPLQIPPPLNVQSSRARSRFAARLAQRKAEAEAEANEKANVVGKGQLTNEYHEDDDYDDDDDGQGIMLKGLERGRGRDKTAAFSQDDDLD